MRWEDHYEAVIGLEVHLQLATRSKIFCRCSTAFGADPNTHVCPICLGHPGTLPVLNREAVVLALRFGLAVGAVIPEMSRFARKNYFYPDLPKGYQITQYEEPILAGGSVPVAGARGERIVRLERAHLEEDAGKSIHAEPGEERGSKVDLNRAGTPLLEIVTRPDLRTPAEARTFLQRVRELALWLGISDGNMEEGSLRADANISLRPHGETALRPKVEIKNLNSFRFVERALAWEFERQAHVYADGGIPEPETRLWDERAGRTRLMRTKEEAEDYRYFPEPDLPPLVLTSGLRAEAMRGTVELPWDREKRYAADLGLSGEDAATLVADPLLARYFEAVIARAGDARLAAAWVLTEILRVLREGHGGWSALRVDADALGDLLAKVKDGSLSARLAKSVLAKMAERGETADAVLRREGWAQIEDESALRAVVREVLDAHPDEVQRYLAGKESVRQFFLGQIMRRTRGQARPDAAGEILASELDARRKGGAR